MKKELTLVTGETGVGKTRFCRRLTESSYIDASVIDFGNLPKQVGVSEDKLLVIDNCSSKAMNLVLHQWRARAAGHIIPVLQDDGLEALDYGDVRTIHLRQLRHRVHKLRYLISIISAQRAREAGKPVPEIFAGFMRRQ